LTMGDRYRDDDRDRNRDRSRDRGGDRPKKQSLLVRNLNTRTSAEELREVFSRFGEVRDVYMPRDHYTREPRGFAFVEFLDNRDAADAQEGMDRRPIGDREVREPKRISSWSTC